MNLKEIMEKLQAPFLPEEIEWRVGSTNKEKTKGLALAYVTNRAIQNRLDDVFSCFGWQNQFKEWKGNSQICGISVWDEEKADWITKWDGASDSNMEATKGGLSDSMKRAAYQWGIGRYLYNLPSVWCKLKPMGKSYALDEIPKLPTWALPKNYKGEGNGVVIPVDLTDRHSDGNKPIAKSNKSNDKNTSSNSKSKLCCEKCGKQITDKVGMFSTSNYGKKLCMDCQKAESKVK